MIALFLTLLACPAMAQDALVEAQEAFSPYVDTALTYAVKWDSVDEVVNLIDHGAKVNEPQPISQYSPLMLAAKHNRPEMITLLLANGANVNQSGVFGRNPLHIAALHNFLNVAKILLLTNVDVNARGKLCPLAVASRQGFLDFVNLLLTEAKAGPTAKCLASAKNMAEINHHTEVSARLNAYSKKP